MSENDQQQWTDYKEKLLDGLSGNRRQVTSSILENTRREIRNVINESTSTGSSVTNNIARYDQIFMPLVRRVTPSLLSMDLVGNQPLNGPSGLVRTLRFYYSQDVETSSGSGTNEVTAGDEASGENIYEEYSLLATGEAYDANSGRSNLNQTIALEGDRGYPMNVDVVNQTITTKTRKLSAVWSREADQDAANLDGLDLETELVNALSDEIARELDRELLGELNNLAGTVNNLDFSQVDGRHASEKFTGISIALSELSNQVAIKTRRGGATWMVVSPSVLTALRNADNRSFTPAEASSEISPRESLFAGVFNGSIRVYVDIYASTDYALLGYKGSSELDTGFVYAPYVPVLSSGVQTDTTTFDPRMSLMTRYAFGKFTDDTTSLGHSADFYARGVISNLTLGFN